LNYKQRAATANGHLGELMREYAQQKSLNRRAFSIVLGLVRLAQRDPREAWVVKAYMDDYLGKSGFHQMIRQQGELLPAFEDEEIKKPHLVQDEIVEDASGEPEQAA
jgi:hypothetical protein